MNSLALTLVITALTTPGITHDSRHSAHPMLTLSAPALAGPPPGQAPPAPPRAPQPAQGPQGEREMPPPPPPAPPPPAERRPLPTRNVKVDVTITDQTGTGTPTRKVVSMVVADGRSSGVRSVTGVPFSDGGGRELPLNVDAVINVTPDGKVLLDLRFNYSSLSFVTPAQARRPPGSGAERDMADPRAAQSTITENLTVLLTPGTPTVIARSADAATDRTVTVEVKADILK